MLRMLHFECLCHQAVTLKKTQASWRQGGGVRAERRTLTVGQRSQCMILHFLPHWFWKLVKWPQGKWYWLAGPFPEGIPRTLGWEVWEQQPAGSSTSRSSPPTGHTESLMAPSKDVKWPLSYPSSSHQHETVGWLILWPWHFTVNQWAVLCLPSQKMNGAHFTNPVSGFLSPPQISWVYKTMKPKYQLFKSSICYTAKHKWLLTYIMIEK